ncbi:MAG: ComF family protein [Candidatus Cryptobacteroides sp.]
MLRKELQDAGDLLIPRECLVCGRKLLDYERHLCIYCEADLPLTYYWTNPSNPMSDKLNALIQRDLEKSLDSGDYIGGRREYARAAALFFYRGDAGYRKIPQRLKYSGDYRAGQYYGNLLGDFLVSSGSFNDVDIVMPVPLHWTRRWSRGYNQAEIIATGIAERLGTCLRSDILMRRRKTGTQTRLGVEAKAINVENAFAVRSGVLSGEGLTYGNGRPPHILIVDDVFTTGATIASCCSAVYKYFGNELRISAATLGFVSPD